MGLFSNKHDDDAARQPDAQDAVDAATAIFDDDYRKELQKIGRDHFKKILSDSTASLSHDVDTMMQQVAQDMRQQIAHQLDATIASMNNEITHQMNDRITEFNRIASEAQDVVTQSLNHNAQLVYEKYQQLSANLQQALSSQEVQMITVFQENKAQVTASQEEQHATLQELQKTVQASRERIDRLNDALEHAINDQSKRLGDIYTQNLERVDATAQAQQKSLDELNASAEALKQKHDALSELLDTTVAQQKDMVIGTLNDNMARIIEHYLVAAMGEQSDIKSQIPSILAQMEQHKDEMMEDMKL